MHDETEKDKQTKTLSRESGAKKQPKGKANERKEKTLKKTVTRESKMFSRRKSLAGNVDLPKKLMSITHASKLCQIENILN